MIYVYFSQGRGQFRCRSNTGFKELNHRKIGMSGLELRRVNVVQGESSSEGFSVECRSVENQGLGDWLK